MTQARLKPDTTVVIRHLLALAAVAATIPSASLFAEPGTTPEASLPRVLTNDNRQPAGTLADNTLTLNLRAAAGVWRPEGEDGPALQVEAFGETNADLLSPAPLLRVDEGTTIVATVRNDLDSAMQVHGLCERSSNVPCAPVDVPSHESRLVRFASGRAGTYYYWATTTGMPLGFRGGPDTQLSGAFIVDPPSRRNSPYGDRIIVITEWTSLTRSQLKAVADADDPGARFMKLEPKFTSLMNGLSWPATERLTYSVGESVRWRVLNLSTQLHPMHLHGFYFEVDALGDGSQETTFADGEKPRVVTQLMAPGNTLNMRWTPEKAGNWLFHCHRMLHVSLDHRIGDREQSPAHQHDGHDLSAGMSGMVIGVSVLERDGPSTAARAAEPSSRKLTLTLRAEANRYGDSPAYGFDLSEGNAPEPAGAVSVPGPTIVLRRGEPVEITVVNRLAEGTAIHWHGIELESYYDGVHGWSGVGARIAPLIEPGGSFAVRFTPPRTGTFIYHTHLHDNRQLASGLYGALVVVEPGETFDPAIDHVLVIGRGGPAASAPAVLNGTTNPAFVWKAGLRHRVRLINITPDDVFVVGLESGDGPATWRPVTKDGAPLPASQCAPKPARQTIAVGETYDFEYEAQPGRQLLWVGVRSVGGKWQVQGRITIK
jgi:FtsP/CotA-like multicopper oxidase with cupredoxin domain